MDQYHFPFEPPMEDLKMLLEDDGCTCYIFDTISRKLTKEMKREADRRILSIYYLSAEANLIKKTNERGTDLS